MGNCISQDSGEFYPFDNNSVVPGPTVNVTLSKNLEYTIPGKISRTFRLCRRELGTDIQDDPKVMSQMSHKLSLQGSEGEAESSRLNILAKAGYTLRIVNTVKEEFKRRSSGPQIQTEDPKFPLGSSEQIVEDLKMEACYVFLKNGNFKKAHELFGKAHAKQVELFGVDHWKSLKTMEDMGMVLCAEGRLDEAVGLYTQVYQGYKKIWEDPQHPETISVLGRIGWALGENEMYDEALAILRQVYEVQALRLGGKDPETLETLISYFNVMQKNSERQGRGVQGQEIER